MKPLARMAVQEHHGVTVVGLSGEIDTSNGAEVGGWLGAIANGQGLVVDLSEVTYLNSATVKLLFDLSERMRQRQQQLRLVLTETAPMSKVFQVLGFGLVVPLHTSIGDALQMHANAMLRGAGSQDETPGDGHGRHG